VKNANTNTTAPAGAAKDISMPTHDEHEDRAIETLCIRGGLVPDPTTGAITTPIIQSATYVQGAIGVHKGHTYSRASNPTVSALEANLGSLENAPPAVCFATGLAAIHALFLGTLKAGDHVVCSDVIYGGTYRLLKEVLSGLGIQSSFVDTSRVEVLRGAIKGNTRLVLIETPGNPTLKLTDVAAVASVTRSHGVLLAVDNTFLTPVGLRPLDLGADISVYSTTKYIEGHNATVGGSLTSREVGLNERFRFIRKSVGSIQAPQDAWLTLRGIKTLPVRLRQHTENAQVVAEWLEGHPAVERVWYPGLRSFPQYELARRQHRLHSGILSFELKGGTEAGVCVLNSVRLISLAESLGAVESLITHPVTMTHGSVPKEERLAVGITDGLIRLSVGLEDPKDLIADLEQALARVTGGETRRVASVGGAAW
jgi:cystathionine beta-lyase/cystathionine gamma-synthase